MTAELRVDDRICAGYVFRPRGINLNLVRFTDPQVLQIGDFYPVQTLDTADFAV